MPRLRIHFGHADIARTRLKMDTDLMWEAVGSVQVLQHNDGAVFFGDWRRHVRRVAERVGAVRAAVRTLMALAPHAAYFPDFLTPSADVSDYDTAIDAVLSTSPSQLRAEVGMLQHAADSAAWLRDLAAGRSAGLRQLRLALDVYVKELVEPYRPVIDVALRDERAGRIRDYLDRGPEGLLAGYEPIMTWRPPVLTVDYPVDRDLHLDGAGLLLVPCYFCFRTPVALADPGMRQVLVLPIRPGSRLLGEERGGDKLAALLGATRADILRSVLKGSTTSRLAKLNNITLPTVSHHTGVLREAGLINTIRQSNSAVHLITPLGLSLLTEPGIRASDLTIP
ncbi:ArsR/SmtB family transcription factor [Actinokineospora sp. 24-640]